MQVTGYSGSGGYSNVPESSFLPGIKKWVDVTENMTAEVNTGYTASSLSKIEFTLPTGAYGDEIRIIGTTLGGWKAIGTIIYNNLNCVNVSTPDEQPRGGVHLFCSTPGIWQVIGGIVGLLNYE